MKKAVFIAELFLTLSCACCSQPVIFHTIQHPAVSVKAATSDKSAHAVSDTDSYRKSIARVNIDQPFSRISRSHYLFAPTPNRIVFMVDDSGSTLGRRNDPGDDPSFERRIAAVSDIISEYDHIPILYAFGKFGAGRARFYNLCSKCLGGRRFFGSALEAKAALNEYVESKHLGGDTPYLPTLFAIENLIELDPSPTYAVVFISDGEPTDVESNSELDLEYDLAHLVRLTLGAAPNRGHVDFNTIYFGPLPGSQDDHWFQAEDSVTRLQAMASAGHGQFYELREN